MSCSFNTISSTINFDDEWDSDSLSEDTQDPENPFMDGTVRESVYCPFLQTKVYKEIRKCNSIKMCQFTAAKLVSMTHSSVDFNNNIFKKIFDSNELSLVPIL
ncbi:10930_t:CDS:2 [Racocetra persica]|uniref:10930_t:CDS:1 n=1 Tax=Racocetra persica TaxID=160502 RepID=A0ACA9P7J1_9GLOM|nr:10930_t:CDS:2 [Racocetra persica]